MWLLQPPESPQRETGRRGGSRREKALRPQGRGERRHRRDNGGATAPVAASRVFRHQTVAKPETAPAGSAEPGGCVSSCLAESGLTTG
ncbi:hypothetical protein MKV58_003407 [Salmonella enterica]|nr:hypothetical protein [Salmonella enterica]EFR1652066.1 hypothetical protein [Salmonella enterica]EFY7082128.1 hypothetical protein [Salmonella enterica]EHD8189475.1 hypothetical protein [Salmonella enterica]EHH2995798.1 hypothetical protein [Salmonella enterica]